jgi:hypothetical protein
MPTINLTDDQLAAVIARLHQVIDDDGYRHSPRLLPFKSLLAKLEPASVAKPLPAPKPLPALTAKPTHGKRGLRNR